MREFWLSTWLAGFALIISGCAPHTAQIKSDKQDSNLIGSEAQKPAIQQLIKPKTPNPYLDTHLSINHEAKTWFTEAKTALSKSDYQTAEHWFREVNRKYPQYSGALVNLGIIHAQRQEWEKAETMFHKAIQINPKNLYAYNQLGYIYRVQGKFLEAEKTYLKAIKIWPDFANAWLNLGVLYDLYLNRLPDALAAYKQFQLIQQDPEHEVKNWVIDLERRQQNAAK